MTTKLDTYTAVGLAEGFIAARNNEEVIAAWQHLVDTGIAWRLQGFFGRHAQALLDAGVINPAPLAKEEAQTEEEHWPALNAESLEAFLREANDTYSDIDLGMNWWEAYAIDASAKFGVNETIFANALYDAYRAHHALTGHDGEHWAQWYARHIIDGDSEPGEPSEQIADINACAGAAV